MRIQFLNFGDRSRAEFILDNGTKIQVDCRPVNNNTWEIDENVVNVLQDCRQIVYGD